MFTQCCKKKKTPLASQVEIHTLDFTEWECPICFSTIKEVGISFPYRCAHPSCFKCLKDQCIYLQNQGENALNVTCCLCRATVNENWRQNFRISSKEVATTNDVIVMVYDAHA